MLRCAADAFRGGLVSVLSFIRFLGSRVRTSALHPPTRRSLRGQAGEQWIGLGSQPALCGCSQDVGVLVT